MNWLILGLWIFGPIVWKILKLANEESAIKPRRAHDEDRPLLH